MMLIFSVKKTSYPSETSSASIGETGVPIDLIIANNSFIRIDMNNNGLIIKKMSS